MAKVTLKEETRTEIVGYVLELSLKEAVALRSLVGRVGKTETDICLSGPSFNTPCDKNAIYDLCGDIYYKLPNGSQKSGV